MKVFISWSGNKSHKVALVFREWIKKLLNTLNKACGDGCITDTMLEKAFDVWYPTLERDLK